ncbi:MAG TPA: DUF4384 domain-containing protein, partial [Gammaproteobacteria bacterium]|nr:DUF4384 domain-containing protein [Gammaproteobacteria bacterium]
LFVRYNVSGLRIGAQNILDPASDIKTATKDMMITAMSMMSRKSSAIHFVVLGNDLADITQFHTYHTKQNFKSPDFFIRIGAPQVDKAAITQRQGFGLRFGGDFSAEYSKDRMVSIVSLDMNMGVVNTLEIIPGMTASNSIAVTRRGSSNDAAGAIKKLGALFQIGLDSSEGLNHSVRTLIELGSIELMGRLAKVPYWECLDVPSTNPLVQAKIRDWYLELDKAERRIFTQSKLDALGYYQGPVDGRPNSAFANAVAMFKHDNGLRADSIIDLDLYYRLITDSTRIKKAYLPLLTHKIKHPGASVEDTDALYVQEKQNKKATKAPQMLALEQDDRIKPLIMTLDTGRGQRPVFNAGESLSFKVKTTTDANVYCYYQQADGKIFKVFPNRFTPSAQVRASEHLVIPGKNHFELKLDQRGTTERVMCVASREDLDTKLPPVLSERSLQPLPLKKLDSVYYYYKQVADIRPLMQSINIEVF